MLIFEMEGRVKHHTYSSLVSEEKERHDHSLTRWKKANVSIDFLTFIAKRKNWV